MNAKFAKSLFVRVALMFLGVSLLGCTSIPTVTNGISNFKEVAPGIYRGGQPTDEGWAYLHSKGVKTVIKLDLVSEGSDEKAIGYGMTVVDASGPPSTQANSPFEFTKAPDPVRIRLAVQSLADPKLQPVYVHCSHGEDRTGLVVGLYRVIHDGWTKERAFEEMKANGFHSSLSGLLKVWSDFDGKTLP